MDIRVQLNEEALQRAQLEQLPLFVEGNRQTRLSDVASIEAGQAPVKFSGLTSVRFSLSLELWLKKQA